MAGGCSTVTVMQKNGGRTMSSSDILMELVGNCEAYDNLNCDKLSVTETIEPVVPDAIGGAASVLDNLAQAMTESLQQRDSVVILRMDGEDLLEFISSPRFKQVVKSIFTTGHQKADGDDGSLITLQDYVLMALHQLTIDHGMPPPSDSWVMSNIIEPALQNCEMNHDEKSSISKETWLENELKMVAEKIAQHLKEEPVIVAHIPNIFDGSGIKRLLSSKSELDMALDMIKKELPKDQYHNQFIKEYLRAALILISGLPEDRASDKVDKVVNEVLSKMVNKEDVKTGILEKEKVFKKLIREMLRKIMLELEENPISVSSNFIIHEPLISFCSSLPPFTD